LFILNKLLVYLYHSEALLHPTKESRYNNETTQNRADIEIPNWRNGKTALLDIGITNPTCKSNVNNAATISGYALGKYETIKLQKYSEICETKGKICIPIISETDYLPDPPYYYLSLLRD
jgi:hypothetical protein